MVSWLSLVTSIAGMKMDWLRIKFKVVEHKKFNRCIGRTQEGSNSVHAFLIPNVL